VRTEHSVTVRGPLCLQRERLRVLYRKGLFLTVQRDDAELALRYTKLIEMLKIQSVPQREHHTSPLQRSTG
jgi:hypothetical protein